MVDRRGTACASDRRPDEFVRDLFAQSGDAVRDLDIRRASLEDAYLSLVQQHESGHAEAAARSFTEVTR